MLQVGSLQTASTFDSDQSKLDWILKLGELEPLAGFIFGIMQRASCCLKPTVRPCRLTFACRGFSGLSAISILESFLTNPEELSPHSAYGIRLQEET